MNLLVRVQLGYTPNFTFLGPSTLLVLVGGWLCGWLDISEKMPTESLLDLSLCVAIKCYHTWHFEKKLKFVSLGLSQPTHLFLFIRKLPLMKSNEDKC